MRSKRARKPRPDADPMMGIQRKQYELESAAMDGEGLNINFAKGDVFVRLRLPIPVARRLAEDLILVAGASEQWLKEIKATKAEAGEGGRR